MAHGSRTNLPRSRGNTDLSQASTSLATLSLATFSRAASAALRRKHWRKSLKRAVFVAVVLVTNLSLLVAQTQAYREIHQQIHAPARVSLGAGPLDYVSNAVSKVAGELMRSLANMTTALLSTDGGRLQGTTLSPAGRPLPWQAAVPAAPFSTVNMARANVFTEVPIIDWQPLGRPVAFSLFHNTLGSEPATVTLPEKWTHAYSRHLAYDLGEDVYTLYTDEGGSIPFTAKPGVPDTYIPPAGFHMTLERDGGQGVLTLTYKNQDKDEFDLATGHLASLLDASGNACVLTYEPDPVHGGQRLYQITDASDNVLELGYNGVTGRLVSIAVPPIGSPDHQLERIYEIDYPTDLPPDVTDIVKVSTARRHPTTEEPLFWAEFHTDGPKLVRIIDYPIKYTLESSPGDPIPADGTPTTITYGTNGHIDLVTLAEGLSEQQTRQFHFYILQLPKVRPLQGKAPPVPPQQLPIYRATVQGARTSPAPDVTDYRFDGSSRLTEVTDPLDRVVTEITWDDDNNPLTTTNVLGGVTTRTFDDRGNVLTVQPPVGGPWEYAYDGLNNLTYMEDPLGHETWFDYEDIANPTRPTRIDGPGVSDLTLEWGQGTDGGRDLTYDLAKLRRTIGPNGVEQGFRYWPHTGGGHGHGQLMQSTHGRGDFNGDVHSVSDGVSDPDATGNVTSSGMAGYDCGLMWCALPEDSIYPKIEVCSVPNPDAICLYGDRCCVEYDADGNRTSCLDCPGCEGLGEGGEGEDGGGGCDGGRSAVPVLFNGKGQPLSLPQLTSDMGYEFEYDSLGRKKHKEVIATNGEQGAFLEPVLLVFPDYTVSWSYLDDSGRIEREYYRANLDYQDGYVNTMVETDLAGRVECVTQNGSATSYQYTDATALPAVVETKPDNTVSEYYLDLAGQVTKIVHKNAQGAEVLAFQYQRDDKGRVVRIDEYVEQGPEANVTTYEYGDGHLTEGDLDSDSAQAVEPEKLYYSWFSDLMEDSEYFADGGDPNRLVKEVRTGDNEYYNEYRYDAGGNRLCKIEKQNVAMPGEPADWRFAKVIRYNYAYHPNYNPADPREQGNPESDYGLGEPDPGMSPGYSWSYNVYDLSGEGAGQDKLLSYTEYLFDGDGVPVVDQAAIYTMYEWHTSGGQMSRRMSWNGETQTQMDTAFTYNRSRLQSALVDEIRWPTAAEEQEPGFDLGEWIATHGVRFLEV
ncbi:MAG: hypothetical protein JXQ75_12670, partial [Phycisphaerae bacterium]|nr:hypothetical protein [Phycisphaerae bacterium]